MLSPPVMLVSFLLAIHLPDVAIFVHSNEVLGMEPGASKHLRGSRRVVPSNRLSMSAAGKLFPPPQPTATSFMFSSTTARATAILDYRPDRSALTAPRRRPAAGK
uniref:Uncharacterized protein MLCL622.24 n=1 Tax=Mycobacterium leprae TaxID=1769 RepID=O06087_MYCLR|nr:unknown [Mycobacterium leprae]